MLWQQCRENSEDIKQPVVYIDVTKKIYEKYIVNTGGHAVDTWTGLLINLIIILT
jgi:hypothetical protein